MYCRQWSTLLFFVAFLFVKVEAQQQHCQIPATPWLLHMIECPQPHSKIYSLRPIAIELIPLENPFFRNYNQDLHKIGHQLYISVEATGMVYKYKGKGKNDQWLEFERIDSTSHFGYNIECFTYTDQDSLYNLGGYGLWHYTGHLRNFNFKAHEWDIVPINQEIPVNHTRTQPIVWHDEPNRKIYSLHQIYVNQGLKGIAGQPSITDSCMELDLTTKDWKFLGLINPTIKPFLKNGIRATTPKGLLIATDYDFLIFDLKHNRILKMEPRGILQMIKSPHFQFISWSEGSMVYFGSIEGPIVDSFDISKTNFTVFKDPIYLTPNNYNIGGYSIFASLLLLGSFVYYRKRKKIKTFTQTTTTTSQEPDIPSNTVSSSDESYAISTPIQKGTLNRQEIFTILETSLLQLIIHNIETTSRFSTIEEINHLLGVANKTLDMQKRKRSNTIRSINEKYAILVGNNNHQLIKRVKSEMDGRLNEFYMSVEDIPVIKKLLLIS